LIIHKYYLKISSRYYFLLIELFPRCQNSTFRTIAFRPFANSPRQPFCIYFCHGFCPWTMQHFAFFILIEIFFKVNKKAKKLRHRSIQKPRPKINAQSLCLHNASYKNSLFFKGIFPLGFLGIPSQIKGFSAVL